jgi:hypothetical protein
VIHEHDALLLASASLDFDLPPDALEDLRAALADCPVCAERAASYREQSRLIARLPAIDVSPATARRITAAAMSGRTDTRSPNLLLAAALLLGLLLAIAAVAGALRDETKPIDLLEAEASLPAASIVPVASFARAASPSPEPSEPSSVGSAGTYRPDSIVEVVTANLRVRSQPRVASDSTLFEPLLQPGDRLFVVHGPVIASNYEWYQVAPIGSDPDRPGFALPSGWVARGDHDGTPWIASVTPDCPAVPIEIADLSAMHALERVACFGDTPLSFRAVVEGGSQSGWHAIPSVVLDPDSPSGTDVAIEPGDAVTPSDLPNRRVVLLEGAFDQPHAINCGLGDPEEPWLAVLDCRSIFVVSRAAAVPGFLEQSTAAITISDNLRVRSLPLVADESTKLELLDNGTRLFVLNGPALGSGYVWYQVIVPSIRTKAGGPRVGWVAVGDREGQPWVAAEDFDCSPPSELTLQEFAFLSSSPVFHGGLACYGRGSQFQYSELVVGGHARLECSGSSLTAGTDWLKAPNWTLVLVDDGQEARAVLPFETQALPCGGPTSTLTYGVTGHFDDPAADDCDARIDTLRVGEIDEAAVYECRTRFVVTGFGVTGPGPTPQPSPP